MPKLFVRTYHVDAGLWQKIGGKSFALQHQCVLALKNAKCNNIKDNEDTPASRKLMFLFFLPKAKMRRTVKI